MINQPGLFQLFRHRTGKSEYRVKALPAEGNRQVWQESRVKEYSFIGAEAI